MATGPAIPATHLLLLPTPPSIIKYNTLDEAYGKGINAVLQQLTRELRTSIIGSALYIAVRLPEYVDNLQVPKAARYPTIQSLVAVLYKLICVIATKEKYNVEDAEGIDTRIILLSSSKSSSAQLGSVISVETLAHCLRPWRTIFSLDSTAGEELLRAFLISRDAHAKVHKVPAPSEQASVQKDEIILDNHIANQHYYSVAVGGTFDHIHIGHKLLLTMTAFLLPDTTSAERTQRVLTVGITSNELLKNKKYSEVLESWEDRQKSVVNFLQSTIDFRPPGNTEVDISTKTEPGPNGRAVIVQLSAELVIRCVDIHDPFGPTITDRDITALVVSGETRAGGKAVNDKRGEKDWPTLEVFEVDVLDWDEAASDGQVPDESYENKLSSTKIRQTLLARAKARGTGTAQL